MAFIGKILAYLLIIFRAIERKLENERHEIEIERERLDEDQRILWEDDGRDSGRGSQMVPKAFIFI